MPVDNHLIRCRVAENEFLKAQIIDNMVAETPAIHADRPLRVVTSNQGGGDWQASVVMLKPLALVVCTEPIFKSRFEDDVVGVNQALRALHKLTAESLGLALGALGK
ncbi:hypothetical protein E2P81_ATG03311 [Venturia nashicola]|nr:hypothetical protein E2P81_ATG03311 [Venturia nashicola]